ncbi:hypothetical protein [Aquabacter spiritensis]|uniref:Uncharacterized protein n=1 Tax=Aquabacter spiritensis TaxID=933073 RepID=A0A4R3M1U9_9HYPH|nr:hypothetical protein [Aquabacter spiritensis]TCT06656.1 hypothetical protein EDC64_102135 [Aquabacter spiritensis]
MKAWLFGGIALAASALSALAQTPAPQASAPQTAAPQTPAAPPAPAAAVQAAAVQAASAPRPELRDARYCEILPILLSLRGLEATVYSTIGHNDCPQAAWAGLSEPALRKQFGAVTVIMNGPRHFLMDRIIPKGATAKGELLTLNGITFESRAEVKLSLFELQEKPYSEHTIDRETVYQFDAGKPTFQLKAPDGTVYVMQAYAQIVDPTLSYADLPKLGERLKPPAGWTYSAVTPADTLLLKAEGKATVIQDELKNTYQKLVP